MAMQPVDFAQHTAAELLEILRTIHPQRAGENFIRLKSALEARGYLIEVSKFGWATATLSESEQRRTLRVAVCWSAGRSPVAWVEPARNDYRLVGVGTICVDVATVQITGRRLGWILGLPLARTVELDRERILNVETDGPAVRFEHREKSGHLRAVTLRCEDSSTAERIRDLLPRARAVDFRPQLPAEVAFDERMLSRTPNVPVTVALVLLNLVVFVATVSDGAGLLSSTGTTEIRWGSNFGPFTSDGEWWRLLTSTFIHFGIAHLFFNVWFLTATGPLVERLYGSVTFLFLYCICGVASSLAGLAWHPSLNSGGASGSIFALYGALLAVLIRPDSSIPRSVVRPLRNSALAFTIYALAAGFLLPGVDIAAHFGGLGAGFILGAVFARRLAISDTPATRTSTVFAGAAASAALLYVGILLALRAASSMQGDGLFWRTQHWVERNEIAALAQWRRISEQARKKELNDAQFAGLVERQVLSIWQESEQRLQAVQLDDNSPSSHTLEYLRAFVASRKAAYQLIVKGVREHDPEVSARGTTELARGDQMARNQTGSTTRSSSQRTAEPIP